MTTIDVDTSPLEAAREWRGIGIVAAARMSGLHVAQAEALECGDVAAFETVDEMIAATVLYGASLGIGRDEAMALLDRTMSGTGAQVVLPGGEDRPVAGFSEAVRERSARIVDPVGADSFVVAASAGSLAGAAAPPEAVLDEPVAPGRLDAAMPAVPDGPTPEQAVAASTEIELDAMFGPEAAPWDDDDGTGELLAWEAGPVDDVHAARAERPLPAAIERAGAAIHVALERLVGTERADQVADVTARWTERSAIAVRDARERLRRSEHATLIVAIGAGAVLVALLVAIGGALGDEEKTAGTVPSATPKAAPQETAAASPAAGEGTATTPGAAKPVPAMLPPRRMEVNVFNAGPRKGYARQVAAQLDQAGYRIADVGNAKGDYQAAVVLHPAGRAREGRVLARKLGIGSVAQAPGAAKTFVVVVV